ncbi:MAG: BLUF domain-containing protein [Pseudomonadota bacterium]
MPQKTERLLEILYVSILEGDPASGVVAEIAKAARIANQQMEITGLLVFDGLRFCQQLEGKPSHIEALMERISRDTRHSQVRILHHGPLAQRRFRNFSLGYADLAEIDTLEKLGELEGEAAVAAFAQLPATLDLIS